MKLDASTATAKADAQGDWKVVLPAVKADGKAHCMTVSGKNQLELHDILIGDVWIGSGQSNMLMGITVCDRAKEDVPAANYPKIRLLLVPNVQIGQPAKDIKADWVDCNPKTITIGGQGGWGGFSAALYYFGQRLHKELEVPIGLIDNSGADRTSSPGPFPGTRVAGCTTA